VTVQAVPSDSESVTPEIVIGAAFGLATVIVPLTATSLIVPASWDTETV
jgi:hypothetical protein